MILSRVRNGFRPEVLAFLAVIASSILCVQLYWPTLVVGWFFDDEANFIGLADVVDVRSAWQYVTGGISSEVGRPLSLASFLLNIGDWIEGEAAGFRRVSIALHTINGLLVYMIAVRLMRIVTSDERSSQYMGAAISIIWLMQPMHFTAVLMSVQRMTILAGTLTLVGILSYCTVRQMIQQKPSVLRLFILPIVLGFCTILSSMAKETGALLPLYCYLIERFIFTKYNGNLEGRIKYLNYWRLSKCLCFLLPAAAIAIALFLNSYDSTGYLRRNFDMSDRLITQLVVLWEYLAIALIPTVQSVSPFHDDYPVYSFGDLEVYFAALSFLILCVLMFRFWAKLPLLKFGMCWYFVGHLLESTVVPLELYFEHRNYIPLLGPIIGLVSLVTIYYKKLKAVVLLPIVICVFTTWRITDLWSQPTLAHELMIKYHPNSVRATFALNHLLGSRNAELSYELLEQLGERLPNSLVINVEALKYSCLLTEEKANEQLAKMGMIEQKTDLRFESGMLGSIRLIRDEKKAGNCSSVDTLELINVIEKYTQLDGVMAYEGFADGLLKVLGNLSLMEDRPDLAANFFERSLEINRHPAVIIDIAKLKLYLGEVDSAADFLRDESTKLDWSEIYQSNYWRQEMLLMKAILCEERPSNCVN